MSVASNNTVSIVAIGSELLSGDVQDSNSSFLAYSLMRSGLRTGRIAAVDDEMEQIVEELTREARRASVVFTIGGLGPTSDDITRDAVARAANLTLQENPESLSRLEEHAKRRGRNLTATNRRQALFPETARVIENRNGTADGFITKLSSARIVSLPGPPKEFKPMVEEQILPWLCEEFPDLISQPRRYLRCFGLSESFVGGLMESCGLPEKVNVAYRPQFPELLLTFSAPTLEPQEAKAVLEQGIACARETIGEEFIFTETPTEHLSDAVGRLLTERKLRLAMAESCSGGLLAHRLVSSAGASQFLLASLVTYSNSAKEVFLGVKPSLLEHFGAVSKETAVAMAKGVRTRIGSDIAVSITGIAGPEGGTEEKPVGTIWIGLSTADSAEAYRYVLPYSRNAVRHYSVALALDMIRRKLLNYPLTWKMQ